MENKYSIELKLPLNRQTRAIVAASRFLHTAYIVTGLLAHNLFLVTPNKMETFSLMGVNIIMQCRSSNNNHILGILSIIFPSV
jgi:hypothetical protein